MNQEQFMEIFGKVRNMLDVKLFALGGNSVTVLSVLTFILLLILLRFVIKWAKKGAGTYLIKRGREEKQIYNVLKILQIALWIVGTIILLDIIGISVNGLIAILAALGVGIGFGLQHLINNLVSGIILLFEQPIRVNDIIEVDNEIGKVKEIGLRASLFITLDGMEILVPNAYLLDNMLINLSLSDSDYCVQVDFGVHYKSDPKQVRDVVRKVAEDNDYVIDSPEPAVRFTEYGDSSLNFQLRAWTSRPWDRNIIASDLRYAIFEALKENGIEIPYPQRDLHLISSKVDFGDGSNGKG